MIRFIDTAIVTRYISLLDKEEQKTTFLLSPLTSREVQLINDATVIISATAKDGGGVEIKQTLRNRLFAQLGLRGWENAGKPFTAEPLSVLGLPKKDLIAESLLGQLPVDLVNELGEKVAEMSLSAGIPEKN